MLTAAPSSAFYPWYKSPARTGISNETPPVITADIPAQDTAALAGDAFSKQMLYLIIPIGFGKGTLVKPQTAVFFPSSFDPSKPVDILIYFHGFLSSYPGNDRPIRDYLNYKDCGFNCINLREEIERSGKNSILVAPTLDNKGHSGTLTHWGMLDVYLDKVKAGIAEHFLKKKFGSDKMKKGRLIIAGHSAGGERIAELARQLKSADSKQKKALKLKQIAEQLKASGKPFAKKEAVAIQALANAQLKYRADEFWGFDSMYGSGFTWIDTALRFPQIRLFMYYNPDGHKSKTPTFNMMEAAKKKGALDSLVLINVKNDTERNSHFKIIRPSFRERLADLAAKGDGTNWEYEYENGVDSEVDLKSKKYIQWMQYALNKALGLQMEVNGKIEKNVKKAIADFRKQKGIASTGDFDNDTEAALLKLDIIHPGFFTDSCIYSPIGKKDPSSNVQQEMVRIAEAEYVRWNNGKTKESDSSIQSILKTYWNDTVHNLYGYTKKAAWSAVFISWVVKQAGGETMFPIDDAHSVYTFYSKLNRTRNGLFFRAYRTSEVKPELGDIIVRARDNSGANYDKLSPEVLFTHGQIVVEILPGKIKVIGGNESQKPKGPGVTVNRRDAILSRDGFLHCSTGYFAVIRLDRLGPAPAAPKVPHPLLHPFWKKNDLEFEDTPGTGQPLEIKLWDSVRAHLGKCPVNPDDMSSLISRDYALLAFRGKLAGDFQGEINFLSRFSHLLESSIPAAVKRLLNKLELDFIHNPEASSLDLLPAPAGTEYRNFNWVHDDYPGNKNKKTKRHGKNQDKARKMHKELILLRPERRPNKDETKVMSPEQFCSNRKYIIGLCNNGKSLMTYAKQSFTTMQKAAKADGVDLSIHNDFRYSACENGTVKRTTSNDNPEAVGTFSSHKMGLAVDLNLSFDNKVFSEVTTRPFKQVIEMRTSPSHKWMFLKGALFGWYPLMPEPWHWEYNPPELRKTFWDDLNASRPKKNKKSKELEFASRSILDELMLELDQN